MATKVAINGFDALDGRWPRILASTPELELVRKRPYDAKTNAHLFKYDSAMGRWEGTVSATDDFLISTARRSSASMKGRPPKLPWKDMGGGCGRIDGRLHHRESEKGGYGDHLKAGAKKVVLTVPSRTRSMRRS